MKLDCQRVAYCFVLSAFTFVRSFIVVGAQGNHVFHADTGTIRTPGFPRQYPPSQDMSWTVLLQPFEKITFGMHFRDILMARFDCPKFGQGDFLEYYVNGTNVSRVDNYIQSYDGQPSKN
jgi:hypothetical protein